MILQDQVHWSAPRDDDLDFAARGRSEVDDVFDGAAGVGLVSDLADESVSWLVVLS